MDRYEAGQRIGVSYVQQLSLDELMNFRSIVNGDIAEIRSELQTAKARAAAGQGYSDINWYRRANAAKSFKGILLQNIQTEIKRKTIEQRATRHAVNQAKDNRSFARCLLRAMDSVLTCQ